MYLNLVSTHYCLSYFDYVVNYFQELDDNLAELTAKFEQATAAKLKCQQEAESTASTISLANRLVGGLQSEKVRWADSVQKMKQDERTIGMCLYIYFRSGTSCIK